MSNARGPAHGREERRRLCLGSRPSQTAVRRVARRVGLSHALLLFAPAVNTPTRRSPSPLRAAPPAYPPPCLAPFLLTRVRPPDTPRDLVELSRRSAEERQRDRTVHRLQRLGLLEGDVLVLGVTEGPGSRFEGDVVEENGDDGSLGCFGLAFEEEGEFGLVGLLVLGEEPWTLPVGHSLLVLGLWRRLMT